MTTKATKYHTAIARTQPIAPKTIPNPTKQLNLLLSGLSEPVVDPQTGKVILEPWSPNTNALDEAEEVRKLLLKAAGCDCTRIQ